MTTVLTVLIVSARIPVWYTALLLGAGVFGVYVAAKWTTW